MCTSPSEVSADTYPLQPRFLALILPRTERDALTTLLVYYSSTLSTTLLLQLYYSTTLLKHYSTTLILYYAVLHQETAKRQRKGEDPDIVTELEEDAKNMAGIGTEMDTEAGPSNRDVEIGGLARLQSPAIHGMAVGRRVWTCECWPWPRVQRGTLSPGVAVGRRV